MSTQQNSRMKKGVAGLVSLLLLWGNCGVSFADTPIALQGGTIQIESTEDVISYDDAASHVNFPLAERFSDGTIWMWYALGEHLSGWDYGMCLWSLDNGATWEEPPGSVNGMYLLQFPDDSILQIQVYSQSAPTANHTFALRTWSNPQSTTFTSKSTTVTFPFSCRLYSHRSLIRLPDGTLLHSLYGKIEGETIFSSFVIKSTDNGKTWSYLAMIAGSDDPALPGEDFAGYCEPVLGVLKDGSLLCLLRTNSSMPLMQSKSTDGGATWSTLVQADGNGSICPAMKVLSNGTLVASSGRPGVYLLVDFTGTGDNWQRVDVLSESDSTCSNTSIVEYEPNRCLLFYSKSAFCNYLPVPPDGVNRIVKATIQVTPTTPDTPSITVKSPNGGEVIYGGSNTAIYWESLGNIPTVLVEYSTDNGTTWNSVATVTNIGDYKRIKWQVPTVHSTHALVRVRDASDPAVSDVSDAVFKISGDNDSKNWEGKYECDVLPNIAGFTPWSLATSYTSVNSGVVTVGTYDFNVGGAWNRSDADFDFDTGATIEIRARLLNGQHRDAASLCIADTVSGKMAKFGLEIDGPVGMGKAGGLYVEGVGWSWLDVQSWHVYRMTALNGEGNPVQVYVDGQPLSFTANYASGTLDKEIFFGDLSGSNDATFEIDYIRWTNKGSFVPSTGSEILGDVNCDGVVDATDIDDLFVAVNVGSTDSIYDLDGDGSVNSSDVAYLVETILGTAFGDATLDGAVDVGDLGILAANYGTTSGAGWATGDFTGDGAVDVGDLGVLAANYGSSSSSICNFDADYAKVFGTSVDADDEFTTDDDNDSTFCSSLGLPLIAGLVLMGLMIVKLDE